MAVRGKAIALCQKNTKEYVHNIKSFASRAISQDHVLGLGVSRGDQHPAVVLMTENNTHSLDVIRQSPRSTASNLPEHFHACQKEFAFTLTK